jgi:ribosomal protein S18 acetylase RimI-like enzyme
MIQLRPILESDIPFIDLVYGSTRVDELNMTGWSEIQKEAFITMQSRAQLAEYKTNFPGAKFELILYKQKKAGRIFTWESESEIRLIDITLLPAFRNKGIGTFLLNELISHSHKVRKKISLHVEPANPALYLYSRLGFSRIRNNGRHYYMEREPE